MKESLLREIKDYLSGVKDRIVSQVVLTVIRKTEEVLAETEGEFGGRRLSITGRAGEAQAGVRQYQEFGFASHCPPGTEAIRLAVLGDPSLGAIVASEHPLFRVRGLETGAVCVYSQADAPGLGEELPEGYPGNCRVMLNPDGSIEVFAKSATAKSQGDIRCTAAGTLDMTGEGDAKLTGGGAAEVNGALVKITASGEVLINGSQITLTAAAVNLNAAAVAIGGAGANVTIAGEPMSAFARRYVDCVWVDHSDSGVKNYAIEPDCGQGSP